MKKIMSLALFCLIVLSGCKIECNSPQSARDDNYGVGAGSSSEESGDDKTSGTLASKTGIGDEVITNLAFKKGPVVIALTHDGLAKFTVKMLDSNGEIVVTLVDKIGSYTGKVVVQIPKDADNYILQITADGKWQVALSKADVKSD